MRLVLTRRYQQHPTVPFHRFSVGMPLSQRYQPHREGLRDPIRNASPCYASSPSRGSVFDLECVHRTDYILVILLETG